MLPFEKRKLKEEGKGIYPADLGGWGSVVRLRVETHYERG